MTSTKLASRALVHRLFPPLPDWARRTHPLLRYQLAGGSAPRSARARLLRITSVLALAALVAIGSVVIVTQGFTQPAGTYPVETINQLVFYPVLLTQIGITVLSLLTTTGLIARTQRLQQWDNVRATSHGAELLLRTRWASVFYRLRWPLAVVLGSRAVLISAMLYDLTAFQGRYIDLLLNGIQPETSVPIGVLALALFMTASVLLPFTMIGFDAAFGLLLSTFARGRTSSAFAQIVLILFRVALVVLLVNGFLSLLSGVVSPENMSLAWLNVIASAGVGDWGLLMLYLGRAGEVWATVPFSVFTGAALIVLCFAQAALADVLLRWAARRAQHQE